MYKRNGMKLLFFLFLSISVYSQDSVRVKIIKIRDSAVWMKTLDRPRVKLKTECRCPYKVKDIVWIKKP